MKQLYGLIGYPLTHSFSKVFFNEKFEAENIPAEYRNFEITDVSQFREILVNYPALRGLNVTLPYKEAIIPFLDELDETAEEVGAVNVIRFIREKGKLMLKGYNSDVTGFSESISPLLTDEHNHALILGTGGASKAVEYALCKLGIDATLVSRTPSANQLGYKELTAEVMDRCRVIVNTTPLGMYPRVDACPDIPYERLTPSHLLYDLLYNPDETVFMKKGRRQGATVKNGLEMLLLQAFVAWDIWQGQGRY